jgi:hypothetical protein
MYVKTVRLLQLNAEDKEKRHFHSTSVFRMLRRSLVVLAKQAEKRTIVRDPRKRAVPAVRADELAESHHQKQSNRPLMPFETTQESQPSIGSSLGSYVLMGAGVAVGFAIVGLFLG